jgi:DNA-binding CsgD family transcriptional regulator
VAARAMTDGEREWHVFTTVLANVATTFEDPERARELAESMRFATTAEGLAEYYRTSAEIDLSDHLAQLQAPTLIIHQPAFPFGSLELCQQVAKGIAGSQFIVVGDKSLAGTAHDGMVKAIDAFLRSGAAASSSASISTPSSRPRATVAVLTNREVDVLARIATGLTNKAIARELEISVATVDRHLANLYAKIGARGRVDAALYALRHGYTAAR